ncbi:hypothetical protein ABZ793_06020 [Micromonospora sp. NPDC047465]|uniref:hypothetical protein n=1 Tax=Micromonospora sp. NPDC047465 TaxID=3154813 RepID=UPI0033FFAD2B
MTDPQPIPSGPWQPTVQPTVFPAQTLTVADPLCGHLPGECEDAVECAYWRGVVLGEYPAPETYMVAGEVTLPPHLPGLAPLTDPALRGAA